MSIDKYAVFGCSMGIVASVTTRLEDLIGPSWLEVGFADADPDQCDLGPFFPTMSPNAALDLVLWQLYCHEENMYAHMYSFHHLVLGSTP